MRNGNVLVLVRVVGSTVISLIATIAAAWLLSLGVDIPVSYWIISGLAVAGVVGADVAHTYLSKGGTDEHGSR